MSTFLAIAFGLSFGLILLGFFADRAAVKARINGANGMPILVALILSFLGSLGVAVIAGIFGGWAILGWILLLTIPYHVGLAALLIWRLQSLATRVAKIERAARERWMTRKS